jgi:hypothetical protein
VAFWLSRKQKINFFLRLQHCEIFRSRAENPGGNNRCPVNIAFSFLLRKIKNSHLTTARRIVCRFNQAERFHLFSFLEKKNTKTLIHLVDVLGSFRPHMTNVRVLGTVEQTLEILKQCILVFIQESANVVDYIACVMPRNAESILIQ